MRPDGPRIEVRTKLRGGVWPKDILQPSKHLRFIHYGLNWIEAQLGNGRWEGYNALVGVVAMQRWKTEDGDARHVNKSVLCGRQRLAPSDTMGVGHRCPIHHEWEVVYPGRHWQLRAETCGLENQGPDA